MIWRGLELDLATDCGPDDDTLGSVEIVDAGAVVEAVTNASRRMPSGEWDYMPFVAIHWDGAAYIARILDEEKLLEWCESRLGVADWDALHRGVEDSAQDDAEERAGEMMRERAWGLL